MTTATPTPTIPIILAPWVRLSARQFWHRVPELNGALRRTALCGYTQTGKRWLRAGIGGAGSPTADTQCPVCEHHLTVRAQNLARPPSVHQTDANIHRKDAVLLAGLLARGIDLDAGTPTYDPSSRPRPPCGKCGAKFTTPQTIGGGARPDQWEWKCVTCGWEGEPFRHPGHVRIVPDVSAAWGGR